MANLHGNYRKAASNAMGREVASAPRDNPSRRDFNLPRPSPGTNEKLPAFCDIFLPLCDADGAA
jgi:hypothetical protein